MMPILVVAGHAAHLNPQDQAGMIHGHFGQDAVVSGPPLGRLATVALVLVDEQDPVPGPSQGHGQVDQGVLPFPRFGVIEHLLGIGLADIDDGQPAEVPLIDRSRTQAEAGRHPLSDRPFAGWSDGEGFGRVSCVHVWPPGCREARRAAGRRYD
jgi:hypothetical protein